MPIFKSCVCGMFSSLQICCVAMNFKGYESCTYVSTAAMQVFFKCWDMSQGESFCSIALIEVWRRVALESFYEDYWQGDFLSFWALMPVTGSLFMLGYKKKRYKAMVSLQIFGILAHGALGSYWACRALDFRLRICAEALAWNRSRRLRSLLSPGSIDPQWFLGRFLRLIFSSNGPVQAFRQCFSFNSGSYCSVFSRELISISRSAEGIFCEIDVNRLFWSR